VFQEIVVFPSPSAGIGLGVAVIDADVAAGEAAALALFATVGASLLGLQLGKINKIAAETAMPELTETKRSASRFFISVPVTRCRHGVNDLPWNADSPPRLALSCPRPVLDFFAVKRDPLRASLTLREARSGKTSAPKQESKNRSTFPRVRAHACSPSLEIQTLSGGQALCFR
jgi:hypothetical protein